MLLWLRFDPEYHQQNPQLQQISWKKSCQKEDDMLYSMYARLRFSPSSRAPWAEQIVTIGVAIQLTGAEYDSGTLHLTSYYSQSWRLQVDGGCIAASPYQKHITRFQGSEWDKVPCKRQTLIVPRPFLNLTFRACWSHELVIWTTAIFEAIWIALTFRAEVRDCSLHNWVSIYCNLAISMSFNSCFAWWSRLYCKVRKERIDLHGAQGWKIITFQARQQEHQLPLASAPRGLAAHQGPLCAFTFQSADIRESMLLLASTRIISNTQKRFQALLNHLGFARDLFRLVAAEEILFSQLQLPCMSHPRHSFYSIHCQTVLPHSLNLRAQWHSGVSFDYWRVRNSRLPSSWLVWHLHTKSVAY